MPPMEPIDFWHKYEYLVAWIGLPLGVIGAAFPICDWIKKKRHQPRDKWKPVVFYPEGYEKKTGEYKVPRVAAVILVIGFFWEAWLALFSNAPTAPRVAAAVVGSLILFFFCWTWR
jgi:hypothetical protein